MALDAWEREPWDLILMDVQMPHMDGPTAARAIREREQVTARTRTPIVALTANAMAHQVSQYHAAGMDDFIAKPIEIGRLFAVLQAALADTESATAASAAGKHLRRAPRPADLRDAPPEPASRR